MEVGEVGEYIYLSLHKYSLVNIVLNVHRNHEAH